MERLYVRDVRAALDELAPPALAYEWDKSGLAIGHPDWEVKRVSVMLTVTPETAQDAQHRQANLIVSHHPVIWDPLARLRDDDPHARMCLDLVRARIACFAAHTNLDRVQGGVNDTLADALGLVNRSPLFPLSESEAGAVRGPNVKIVAFIPDSHLAAIRDAVCSEGAGVIGEYTRCTFSVPGTGTFVPGKNANPFSGVPGRLNEEAERRFEVLVPRVRLEKVIDALRLAHPYEEPAIDIIPIETPVPEPGLGIAGDLPKACTLDAFTETVCHALQVDYVRVSGHGSSRVRRIGVLGGAGGGKGREVPADVEVLLTGDVGYHDVLALQQRGIAVVDAGHGGTEKGILPVLARYLRQRFCDIDIVVHEEKDPFRVIVAAKSGRTGRGRKPQSAHET